MILVRFLSVAPFRVMAAIALAGIISGLCSAAILALINHALYQSPTKMEVLVGAMVVLVISKIVSNLMSRWLLLKYAQEMLLNLSVNLCRQVLAAPLRLVEDAGPHRVLTALTSDVPMLGATMQALPALLVNSAVILGCLGYLGWLYPVGLAALLGVVSAGAIVYWTLHASAMTAFASARQGRDELMKAYKQLTDGLKELKMNRDRGDEFMAARLEVAGQHLKGQSLVAMRKYLYLDAWSQALFYFMLASALLFFPRDLPNSAEILTGFAFAALYVMTPVWAIIGALPTLTAGATSLRKLEEVGLTFSTEGTPAVTGSLPTATAIRSVQLANVEFSYRHEGGEFSLGPIDLMLKPGELLFLVGGNGSGKTTLVKLLIGLYTPERGQILVNGKPLTEADRDWYRQHFAVVFFDFQLFDQLLGAHQPDADSLANAYLKELDLDRKVTVKDRSFSTTDLSQGQRKRLALLTALMEERPICVFDEWAADQDPRYKEIFYSRILPMLKARNKTVVVVTHDDRYFHLGDRVIRLDDGKITDSGQHQVKTA